MADIRWSATVERVRGGSGNIVFKKRGETFYFSRRPDFSRRELSPSQKQSLRRFRAAVSFAKGILADPVARKPYDQEAKKKHRTVYNYIISAYLSR